ncbi:MAG: hypothetical protein GVY32_02160 [Gammaproteobacteria bacterium]|nr:hypothetical protein [Gammaproteobacteria bacterium]
MNKTFSLKLALITLLVAIALPTWADLLPTTNPGPHAAMVTGALGEPGQDIYPVDFVQIDDTNIFPREVMWLEPGKYELRVRPFISRPRGLQSPRRRIQEADDLNRIEVVLEAGKVYHIGAHYHDKNLYEPYTLVLYRVEENK